MPKELGPVNFENVQEGTSPGPPGAGVNDGAGAAVVGVSAVVAVGATAVGAASLSPPT